MQIAMFLHMKMNFIAISLIEFYIWNKIKVIIYEPTLDEKTTSINKYEFVNFIKKEIEDRK